MPIFLVLIFFGLFSLPSNAEEVIDATYQLSPKNLAALNEKLQKILKAMHKDGDPEFTIEYSTDRKVNAHVRWEDNRLARGEKPKKATITINRGLMEVVRSEDELAFIVAHEMSHTATNYNLTDNEKRIQSQREEIVVADLGAIERVIQARYNPTSGRDFFLRSIENDYQLESPLLNSVGSHPPHELRITAIDVELKKRHDKAAFPNKIGDPNNWLKEYRESFTPPWSLSEKRPKNMETFLDRLLHQTSLKNLPSHQQVAFVTNLLFNKTSKISGARSLIITGLLYDPHVNPSPLIDELVYDFEKNDFEVAKHIPYDEFTKVGSDHKFHGKDVELLYGWMKETATNFPDFHTQSAVTRSMHELAKGYGIPAVKLDTSPYGNRVILPQSLWRLKPERVLTDQKKILDTSPLRESLEKMEKEIHRYPQEQQVDLLLGYAEEHPNLTEKQSAYLFEKLKSIPSRYWTYSQANRYLELLPQFHKPLWVDRRGIPERDWPGDHSGHGSYEDKPGLMSADRRIGRGTRNYIKTLVQNPEVPLGLRLHLLSEYLQKRWWENSGWQKSVSDAKTFIEGVKSANGIYNRHEQEFASDWTAFDILTENPQWRYTPEDLIEVFNGYDFTWLEKRDEAKRKLLGIAEETENLALMKVTQDAAQVSGKDITDKLRAKGEAGLAESLEKADKQLHNSSYKYNLQKSESLQRHFWSVLEKQGQLPKDSVTASNLHQALARIGNTEFTDNLAEDIYLKQAYSCPNCLESALEKGSIWDFALRKKVFDRWYAIKGKDTLRKIADRDERIKTFLAHMQKWFPEPSYERAEVIEGFSDSIKTNFREAKFLEAAKFPSDSNHEGVTLRIFTAIFKEMAGGKKNKKTPMEFVKFLIGKGEFPHMPEHVVTDEHSKPVLDPVTKKPLKTRGLTSEIFGPARTKRLFDSLSPELKAVTISPFFAKPNGLLSNKSTREEIYRNILSAVEPEFRQDARTLTEALLHAQRIVAPFEENLTLAYLFAQSGRKGRGGGEVLKDLLESQGAVGISLGQKLYQRRLVPEKYLDAVGDLQDRAKAPTRLEAIERAIEVLDLKDPDAEAHFGELLGSASSKIVMEIYHKKGEEAAKRQALKMLREYFDRRLDIEEAKLRESVKYLEEHGNAKFRSLGPLVEDLIETLRKQADLRTEAHNEGAIKRLYKHGETDNHGFKWLVSEPSADQSSSEQHAQEPVIDGKTVRSLKGDIRLKVAAAIFDKDYEILLANDSQLKPTDEIVFERDRHMGNYMVWLRADTPEIYVIDYPLLTSIRAQDRGSLFKLMGLLEIAKNYHRVSTQVSDQISNAVLELAEPGTTSREAVEKNVRAFLNQKRTAVEPTAQVLNLFSSLQKDKIKIISPVYAYLTALGHLEGLAKEAEGNTKMLEFRDRVVGMVKDQVKVTVEQLNPLQKCILLLRGLVPKIVPQK